MRRGVGYIYIYVIWYNYEKGRRLSCDNKYIIIFWVYLCRETEKKGVSNFFFLSLSVTESILSF